MPERKVIVDYEIRYKEVTKAAEEIKRITKYQEEWRQASAKLISTNRVVAGTVSEMRQNLRKLQAEIFDIRNAQAAQTDGQKTQVAELREAIFRQQQGIQVQREMEQQQRRVTRETEKQTRALGLNVKKLLLWGLGARTAFRIFSRVRIMLRDFVKDVAEGTTEQEQMTTASKELRAALAGAFGPDIVRIVGLLADRVEDLAKWMTHLAVMTEINRRVQAAAAQATDTHAQMLLAQGVSAEAVVKTHDSLNESLLDEESALAAVTARMDEFKSKTDETVPSMKAAVNAIRKSSAALRDYRQDLEDIRREWQVADLRAGGDFYRESEKINRELQEAITEINADALADREKALAQANKRMQRQQAQANRNLEKLEAQHELQMEYNRRRYELTQIQNERVYQYQRGLLVAEGDVLAIEDLDARHELEKQAREENFRLQQQQAEAMFQLQLRFQKQAAREQAKILRESLMEQLALIEERRRDELDEVQKSATEQQAQAADAAADAKTDALAALKEQEADLEESNQKRLESEIEFWVDMLQEEGVGKDAIIQFLKNVYGPEFTREMETIATRIIADSERASASFAAAWQTALQSVRGEALATLAAIQAINQSMPGGGPPPRHYPRGYQYGGEFIASRPTTITVGEGYRPERVIVQPMQASMRGQMNVSWTGGAIPVHGSGSLGGADMSAFGQALAQGVATGIKGEFEGFRGQRGQ